MNSLTSIWQAFVDNGLDDEARRFWGPEGKRKELDRPYREVVLYQGRGGKALLTLMDVALYVICAMPDKLQRVKCCLGLPGITKDEFIKMAEHFGFAVEKATKKSVTFFNTSTGEVHTVKRSKARKIFRRSLGLDK